MWHKWLAEEHGALCHRAVPELAPELGNTEVEDPVGSGGLVGLAAAAYQQDEQAESQQQDKVVSSVFVIYTNFQKEEPVDWLSCKFLLCPTLTWNHTRMPAGSLGIIAPPISTHSVLEPSYFSWGEQEVS